MLKRNARLRREYLYRKSLEGKERVAYERKRKIREALAGWQPAVVMVHTLQSPTINPQPTYRGQAHPHGITQGRGTVAQRDWIGGRQHCGATQPHGRRIRTCRGG